MQTDTQIAKIAAIRETATGGLFRRRRRSRERYEWRERDGEALPRVYSDFEMQQDIKTESHQRLLACMPGLVWVCRNRLITHHSSLRLSQTEYR